MIALALFDFDGTITTKDSLADFITFAVGKSQYYIGLFILSPVLLAYALKLIPNHIAKEKLTTHFFKDWDADQFMKLANDYAQTQIDKITRPRAIEKIRWHQNQGHKVVIVSASMESWIKGWCEKNNVELIATKLEIRNNKLTGKFATKNCHGIEKANRVREIYDLNQYDHIYAYGDSHGDKELMKLANQSFYRPFRE
jgi:phosphatidylglycerophosphatase C